MGGVLDKLLGIKPVDPYERALARLDGVLKAYEDCKPSWEEPWHPDYIAPPTPSIERRQTLPVQTDDEGWITVWTFSGQMTKVDPRRVARVRHHGSSCWVELHWMDGSGYDTFVASAPTEENGWWRCPRVGVCGAMNVPTARDCHQCRAERSEVVTIRDKIAALNAAAANLSTVVQTDKALKKQFENRADPGSLIVLEGGMKATNVEAMWTQKALAKGSKEWKVD